MGRYANWISNLTVNQACAHICWFESNPAHQLGRNMTRIEKLEYIKEMIIEILEENPQFNDLGKLKEQLEDLLFIIEDVPETLL